VAARSSNERVLREEVARIRERLERDYRSQFAEAGGSGLDTWSNDAHVGVETRFGDRVGPIWATSVRYRKRSGWLGLVGSWVEVRTLLQAERDLRAEIDAALSKMRQGLRPQTFGRGPQRWR
jgi:hypothetical protein